MRPRNVVLVAVPLGGLGVTVLSCLGATEILLDVRTNIPCTGKAPWQGVSVSVGEPGVDVESRAPVLTTTACSASGEVGTLAIVPSGSNTAEVGIRVVAGITANPETCAANGYAGCVVSRRTITYLPHQTQDVVVELTADCIGNACDLNHTCVEGSCTDTVTATPPVAPDGGVLGGPVRCGDNGASCPTTGQLCCLEVFDGGTRGACKAPADCAATNVVLQCDRSSECAGVDAGGGLDAGESAVCCMNLVSTATAEAELVASQCLSIRRCVVPSGAVGIVEACQDRLPCHGHACLPANGGLNLPYLPGYWYCADGY